VPDGELMNYVQGYVQPMRQDKRHVEQARRVRHEVQLAAFKADGATALATKVMQSATELYDEHKKLAKDDPAKEMLLSAVMMQGIGKMMEIQKGLYGGWNL